jgi:hypothetical protein
MRGIENCIVKVYNDAGISKIEREAQAEVLSHFPGARSLFFGTKHDILQGHLRAIRETFAESPEIDEVLYLEDDCVVRTDTLEYLKTAQRGEFVTSLIPRPIYSGLGNLITKSAFNTLSAWIAEKKYLGLPVPNAPQGAIWRDGYIFGHDHLFLTYSIHTKRPNIPAPIFYLAHFGICGTNGPVDAEAERIQTEMFRGPRMGWLDNVLRVLREGNYSGHRFEILLHPKHFEYA